MQEELYLPTFALLATPGRTGFLRVTALKALESTSALRSVDKRRALPRPREPASQHQDKQQAGDGSSSDPRTAPPHRPNLLLLAAAPVLHHERQAHQGCIGAQRRGQGRGYDIKQS